MTDPAVEAARRAGMTEFPPRSRVLAMNAAREALAPLKELHLISTYPGICQECHHDWPCPTARLIYREDEL